MTKLSKLIPPHFYEAWRLVKTRAFSHFWFKGGRGSIKSTIVSIFMVLLIMKFPNTHGICIKKYANQLNSSVYKQIGWAINMLGVADKWDFVDHDKGAPPITYLPTGQKIYFIGLDDPEKVKSIKVVFGKITFSWYEEVHQLRGFNEIRKANQSIRRGGIDPDLIAGMDEQEILRFLENIDESEFITFYSYNPPIETSNWVNITAVKLETNPKFYIHHSSWDMLPRLLQLLWLGQDFIDDALWLKDNNPRAYQHEYDGIPVGYGNRPFNNVTYRTITDEEIARFDNVEQGLDFGFANDPNAWTRSEYDEDRDILYIFDEIYSAGLSDKELARRVLEKVGMQLYNKETCTADSAEPKAISNLNDRGMNVSGAKKGAGSVEDGLRYLGNITEIVIDKVRTPFTFFEFYGAAFAVDKAGVVLPKLRKNFENEDGWVVGDHTIDSIRYRMEVNKKADWGWGHVKGTDVRKKRTRRDSRG